jgi:thiazole synthase ThiGH ThiG subunit
MYRLEVAYDATVVALAINKSNQVLVMSLAKDNVVMAGKNYCPEEKIRKKGHKELSSKQWHDPRPCARSVQ